MTTAKKLMTAEDLLKLPDDGKRYELLDGELVEMAPAGWRHGHIEGLVALPLLLHTRQHGGMVLTGDPGIFLRRNPDRVRAPDVCYYAPGREPAEEAAGAYTDIIPDLIVEVVSPGDGPSAVLGKVGEWLGAGAQLVWAVYPHRRVVVAYRSMTDIRVYTEADTLDAEPVLPGFTCLVATLFA